MDRTSDVTIDVEMFGWEHDPINLSNDSNSHSTFIPFDFQSYRSRSTFIPNERSLANTIPNSLKIEMKRVEETFLYQLTWDQIVEWM